jgi:hypothetical protein
VGLRQEIMADCLAGWLGGWVCSIGGFCHEASNAFISKLSFQIRFRVSWMNMKWVDLNIKTGIFSNAFS